MATYTLAAAVVSGFRVRLTVAVTSPTVGATMALYRASGATEELVAGASALPATSVVVNDALVPLGRPVSYRLEATDAGTATSTEVTVVSSVDVLSDPTTGVWVECQVYDYGEAEFGNAASGVRVISSDEVVTSHDVESLPTFPLVVHTYSLAQDAAMSTLCAPGGALLLRWAGDYGEPDWVLQPMSGRRRYRYASTHPQVRHSWPLMQAKARDLAALARGDNYDDLRTYLAPGTTGADLRTAFPGGTWHTVRLTDLKAG